MVSDVSGRVATILGMTFASQAAAETPMVPASLIHPPVKTESCLDLPRQPLPPVGFFAPHKPKEPDMAERIKGLPSATARR